MDKISSFETSKEILFRRIQKNEPFLKFFEKPIFFHKATIFVANQP